MEGPYLQDGELERCKALYELWEKWVERSRNPRRDFNALYYFREQTGEELNEPLTGMYEAFLGGLYQGIIIGGNHENN